MKRVEELRDLIHTTLNKIVWICTHVSNDEQSIEINVGLGNRTTILSFPIDLVEQNLSNGADFVTMISKPLGDLLEPKKKGIIKRIWQAIG